MCQYLIILYSNGKFNKKKNSKKYKSKIRFTIHKLKTNNEQTRIILTNLCSFRRKKHMQCNISHIKIYANNCADIYSSMYKNAIIVKINIIYSNTKCFDLICTYI